MHLNTDRTFSSLKTIDYVLWHATPTMYSYFDKQVKELNTFTIVENQNMNVEIQN